MQKLRRFFVRSRTFNAAAARATTQVPADDDSDSTRLSGAFIIVLVLHVIAVVGVFAFARIKESRKSSSPQANTTQTAAPKNTLPKSLAPKTPTVRAPAPAPAASLVAANPTVTPHPTPKPATAATTPAANDKPPQSTDQKTTPTPVNKKAPATADKKTPKKTPKIYIVRKSETAMKIARDHGCSYEDLLKLNNIKDPKKIQSGQALKIPVKNG
jgi:LysM repeat protein